MSSKFIQKVVEPGKNMREKENENSGRKNVLVGFFDNFMSHFFNSNNIQFLFAYKKFLQQHRKFVNIKVNLSDMIRLHKLVLSNSLKIDLIKFIILERHRLSAISMRTQIGLKT